MGQALMAIKAPRQGVKTIGPDNSVLLAPRRFAVFRLGTNHIGLISSDPSRGVTS